MSNPAQPIDVAVIGATGYTGRELLRLLARHPNARVKLVTSRQHQGTLISDIHPVLRGVIDLPCVQLDLSAIADSCAFCFCALPHGTSMEICGQLVERGVRVIDLSADYRLRDPNLYAEWYNRSHRDAAHLKEAVYGLPELFAADIARARLVANPGCYPTAAVLALAPLAEASAIHLDRIVIDAKSGISGAGRSPSLDFHFPECDENLWAYKPGEHRHTPEMQTVLAQIAGDEATVRVLFVPHIVPLERGILATIYAPLRRRETTEDLLDMYSAYYAGSPFVRVSPDLPRVKNTAYTNFCDLSVRVVGDTVLVFSALDNLLKGASGTAVQNLNLMLGLPETAGLLP